MSIVGAFIAGVTGVTAQTQQFGAISDNIANANTVGYKPTDMAFQTLVTQRSVPTNYSPGGVQSVSVANVGKQGLLEATQSTTDLGITGRGFLPVTNSVNTTTGGLGSNAEELVTRAGSFHTDANGFLVNSGGYYLLGVPTTTGTTTTLPTSLAKLTPVQLPAADATIAGTATSTVNVAVNLPASDAVGATHAFSSNVYDSTGVGYTVTAQFTKLGTNSWQAVATGITPVDQTAVPTVTGTVSGSPTTLTFNSDGTLASPSSAVSLGSFTLSNGASLSPTFNFGTAGAVGTVVGTPTTEFGSNFSVSSVKSDGTQAGTRTGVSVTAAGQVQESYSNGAVITRFQVPLVNFNNPQGLEAQSGNAWLQTQTSGTPQITLPNQNGAGTLTPSTLEQSSVDLASEFTDMIVSQRTYDANTKIITTADQMYQTVAQLR